MIQVGDLVSVKTRFKTRTRPPNEGAYFVCDVLAMTYTDNDSRIFTQEMVKLLIDGRRVIHGINDVEKI